MIPFECLSTIEITCLGDKREAWVSITGDEGNQISMPLELLLDAAHQVQSALLNHLEHAPEVQSMMLYCGKQRPVL